MAEIGISCLGKAICVFGKFLLFDLLAADQFPEGIVRILEFSLAPSGGKYLPELNEIVKTDMNMESYIYRSYLIEL